jgi:hypothetical protein
MHAVAIRIAVVLGLIAGLFAATTAPALADPAPPRAVSAKAEPLVKKGCASRFIRTWRRINHASVAHADYYYESRRKAMQVMYDQLRWLLADPEAQDLIPAHEAMVARDREEYQPLVAKQRDEYLQEVATFRAKYLQGQCLSKDGKQLFKTGMRYLRRTYQDIYKAHEKLFGMELAVMTAQADLAGQYLQDADLEHATVEENLDHSLDAYDRFRKAS